jgi:hypothetical protein
VNQIASGVIRLLDNLLSSRLVNDRLDYLVAVGARSAPSLTQQHENANQIRHDEVDVAAYVLDTFDESSE